MSTLVNPGFMAGDKVHYKEAFGSGYFKYNGSDTGEVKYVINADSALVVYPANPGRGYYKEYGVIVGLHRLVKVKKFESGWYRLKNYKDLVYYVKDMGDGRKYYTHVYHTSSKLLETLGVETGGISVGTILDGDLIKMEFVTSIVM